MPTRDDEDVEKMRTKLTEEMAGRVDESLLRGFTASVSNAFHYSYAHLT